MTPDAERLAAIRGTREKFERELRCCGVCFTAKPCQFLKAAHVPLYKWVCARCKDDWISE